MASFGPISYDIGAESPLTAFNQGLQTGANTINTQLQTAQNATALAQQQQLTKDAAAVAANPTPQAIAGLALKYPMLSDKFKSSFDMLNQQQQQDKLNQAIPIYAAVQNGKPEVAADLLNKQADAYENAGRPQDAAQARTMAKLVTEHPEAAKLTMGLLLAGAQGHEKFTETFKGIGEERRANELQPAKVAETVAGAQIKQAEAGGAQQKVALENSKLAAQNTEIIGRLNLDRDKNLTDTKLRLQELSQKYGELKPEATKLVNDNVQAAVTSEQTANQWNDLASRLTAADTKGRWATPFAAVSEVFGGNVDVKTLRQEYVRLRSSGMLKELPPGSASDRDMAEVKAGFPNENDNAETVVRFARGMAKVLTYEAAMSSAKAEWVNANKGSLGKAQSSMEINGIKVPAGFSFEAFAKLAVTKIANKKTVENADYFKFANPATP